MVDARSVQLCQPNDVPRRNCEDLNMDTIVNRIAALEEELANIKSLIASTQPGSHLLQHIRRLAKFLLSYWLLLSFAVAVGTAVYVKYAFEIDYFEQYRDQSTTKKLSELYRQLGDRMLARSEWESAASAYTEALKIYSHNAAATSGLVKAQVFLPDAPQKFLEREVVDVKLQYLEELFPNDFIVLFLKGVRSLDMNDYGAAQKSLEESIAMNPNFAGGYLVLGYIEQGRFDLEGAIENYDKALKLDPQNPNALNNLGFMDLLSGHYEEAMEHLRRSEMVSPRFLTAINLGDAYRYMGDHSRATQEHTMALRNVTSLPAGYERYLAGDWTYNFMPLAANDTQTIKRHLIVQTRDQKLAIAHLALALDYATTGNISDASSELDKAESLEHQRAYGEFYANKIAFMQRFPKLGDQTKKWLAEQRAKLLLN
jgi:tetratricopeptide (TPR) repeat protein